MENLNAEQIKKALECCTSEITREVNCETCYMLGTRDCMTELKKNALALIKSQEQRIKELTQANEQLSESYDHLEKTKDELLAERSRLTEENAKLTRKLEIANLKIECKERILDSYMLQYGTVADKEVFLKKERADTVRKMSKLVKERLDISVEGYSTDEVRETVFDTIDQIAKEIANEDIK